MLRLLHTADWHLGHTLHGRERTREHVAFLEFLLEALEAERADALLVAGDVFDAANPPASAVALFYRFLAKAWTRRPELTVVIIGGNHDSASRLEAPHPLLDALGRLHVVGALPRRGAGLDEDRLVIPLPGPGGRVEALAVAVPYLRPADLALEAPGAEATLSAVHALHARALEAARARARGGEALVVLSHLHLAGGRVSELSERRVLCGSLPAEDEALFPDDVAYAALGHLHLAQAVGGRAHVRYAGSPIPLSFDERHYPHQVVVVELQGGRARAIRSLRVPQVQELRRVPGDEPRPLAEVVGALAALPDAGETPEETWPFIEVRVALTAPEPALRSTVEAALEGKAARLLRIAPPSTTGTGAALGEAAGERTLHDLHHEEVFLMKWTRDHGAPPPAEVMAAYHELVEGLLRAEAA